MPMLKKNKNIAKCFSACSCTHKLNSKSITWKMIMFTYQTIINLGKFIDFGTDTGSDTIWPKENCSLKYKEIYKTIY